MARTYQLRPGRPSRLRIDYDRDLNAEQRAVVEASGGPKLVIAGAGSGKTRALTYRVARLIDCGVEPERILLLTFTNKAAREMLTRVSDLVGPDARRVWGGTFHHVGNLLLRDVAQRIGYRDNYSIVDREDCREVMNSAIAAAGIDHQQKRFPKADVLIDIVSTAVNTQRSIAEVVARRTPYFLSHSEAILRVARAYVERKLQMNAMDFDDLLLNWWAIMAEAPDVARLWQERFSYLLVDEYQDTNTLQGAVVDRMAEQHRNVTVVGDDCQSIYSFRGADFENILRFPERYPDAQLFHLTVNYRSTPEILELANRSIEHNVHRFEKELRAVRPPGVRPALVPCRDVYQQADFVAQRILDLRDEGVPLEQIAVLYRAHHHAMEIQVELTRRGIPFRVRSGLRFFEQAHIKDVLSYLRFVFNPLDELAFKRAVKLHEGIGNRSAEQLFVDLRQQLARGVDVDPVWALDRLTFAAGSRGRTGFRQFLSLVREIASPAMIKAPGQMIATVAERGYRDYLRRQFSNAEQRIDDIEQLADYAEAFEDLGTLVNELALVSSFGAEEVAGADAADERVTLSSVHQAKGLEWSRVFVVWLADGRFPVDLALKEPGGEEEERRLFYVATTRARDELLLTFPLVHRTRDQTQVLLARSRFVVELPEPRGDDGDLYEPWSLQEVPAPAGLGPAKVLALPRNSREDNAVD
ncbi:MAG: ATP-dependent helicase [Deltaproteobacteria bacterium]|nr:ATP-dependent helicase [Deltaproteobacteria bacterium]